MTDIADCSVRVGLMALGGRSVLLGEVAAAGLFGH